MITGTTRPIAFALLLLVPGMAGAFDSGAPALQEFLLSCDAEAMSASAARRLGDRGLASDPTALLVAAYEQRLAGKKEDAALYLLLASLGIARADASGIEQDKAVQAMKRIAVALIDPSLHYDREFSQRVADRYLAWRQLNGDPPLAADGGSRLPANQGPAGQDASVRRLPKSIDPESDRALRARKEDADIDKRIKVLRTSLCLARKMDWEDVSLVGTLVKRHAEMYALMHPLVRSRAVAGIESASVGTYSLDKTALPRRLTVGMRQRNESTFFAEVDAIILLRADREVDGIRTTLACLTDLWIGPRDISWRDVCVGDTNAIRPAVE